MPISKLIWNMSLPIIASMLVQALYNIVDSVFVSRVSEQALTAVSLAFPAQNLMIGLATGTAVGVNALMGRALGAGQRERADKVANHGILLALVGFVISALLGATCSDLFFRSQTQIENIICMGNDYLRVVTIGSLGMFCQIMYERLLQGTGRSILSMYTQGLGAIINIILDPIFIFTLNMGVTGAAVATIIGQFCGCALAIYFNHKKNTDITLSVKGFRPDFRLIGEIYAIGLPSVIMIAIGSVMTFLMNKILITYHGRPRDGGHRLRRVLQAEFLYLHARLRYEQRRGAHRGLQLRRPEPQAHGGDHQARRAVRLHHHGLRHRPLLGHPRPSAEDI